MANYSKPLLVAFCIISIVFFFVFYIFIHTPSSSKNSFELTETETAYLQSIKNKPLTFAYSYDLLTFQTNRGKSAGVLEPFFNVLRQDFGLTIQTQKLPWQNALDAVEHQTVDFYGPIALTTARKEKYDTINAIIETDLQIVTRIGDPLSNIINVYNKKIGVLTNSVVSKTIQSYLYPNGVSVTYPSMDDLLDGLEKGEIDCLATVDHAEAEILRRSSLYYEFTVPNAYFPQGFISNNSELAPLLKILNRYIESDEGQSLLAEIQTAKSNSILEIAETIYEKDIIYLQRYIDTIQMYSAGMQYPFCFYENGEWKGVQVDVNTIFTKLTGVSVEMDSIHSLEDGIHSAVKQIQSSDRTVLAGSSFQLDRADEPSLTYSLPFWKDNLRMFTYQSEPDTIYRIRTGATTSSANYINWLSTTGTMPIIFNSYETMLTSLKADGIDAVFISDMVYDYLYNIKHDYSLQKYGDLSAISNVHMLFNTKNKSLNRLMNASIMLQQTMYPQSRISWENKASTFKYDYIRIRETQQKYLFLFSAIFVLMLAGMFWLLQKYRTYDQQISQLIRRQQTFDLAWVNIKTKRFLSKGKHPFFTKWGLKMHKEKCSLQEMSHAFGWDLEKDYLEDLTMMEKEGTRFIVSDKSVVSSLDGDKKHYRRYLHRINNHKLMLCLQDITQQMDDEEALKKTASAAQEANKTKSLFLANMSHEIRTPMNGIIGLTELALDDDTISSKTLDYLVKIKNSADGLLAIINDILDLSKIEAREMHLEKIPFSLQAVVKECETINMPRAESKKIALYFETEDTLSNKLIGDPTKLRQILLNLLSNAIKFTEKGSVSLLTKIEPLQTRSGEHTVSVYFEVRDTGIGMSQQQIHNIFEPFKQADGSTTRQYGGTGLGLSISKNLLEMMGTSIGLESALGIGSRFCFTLTFPVSNELAEPVSFVNSGRKIERPLFSAQVLLCEDNQTNQLVAIEHLEKLGIEVTIADNGQIGIEKVKERLKCDQPFDIIFMDIQMPVLDGLTTASRLLAMGVRTPIIAMTANAMAKDREECAAAGMVGFISKPFKTEDLWLCLLTYLTPIQKTIVEK